MKRKSEEKFNRNVEELRILTRQATETLAEDMADIDLIDHPVSRFIAYEAIVARAIEKNSEIEKEIKKRLHNEDAEGAFAVSLALSIFGATFGSFISLTGGPTAEIVSGSLGASGLASGFLYKNNAKTAKKISRAVELLAEELSAFDQLQKDLLDKKMDLADIAVKDILSSPDCQAALDSTPDLKNHFRRAARDDMAPAPLSLKPKSDAPKNLEL